MYQQQKNRDSEGTMGSKSKIKLMKSYKNIKKEAATRKTKKGNAQDIISKSFQKKHMTSNRLKVLRESFSIGPDSIFVNLPAVEQAFKSLIMNTLKNHVQLIGNVGQEPQITNLENGKKVARLSIATNEHYKNNDGEKVQDTEWHTVVAWGKTAEIIENYVGKGKEIAIMGKLRTRTYTNNDGNQRYVTEVEASEILLLGNKSDN